MRIKIIIIIVKVIIEHRENYKGDKDEWLNSVRMEFRSVRE